MGVEPPPDTAVHNQESDPAAAAAVVVPVEKETETETKSDMAKTSTSLPQPTPSWFTPKRYGILSLSINPDECGNSSKFQFFCIRNWSIESGFGVLFVLLTFHHA